MAEVLPQQGAVDGDVEIEQAGAITTFADVTGPRGPTRVQVIDGAEVVVLDRGTVHGDGVRHLHGGLDVVRRRVGQHAAEHGNVHRLTRVGQQLQLVLGRLVLALDQPAHQRLDGRQFLGAEMRELLDVQILVVLRLLVRLGLAELARDVLGPLAGRLLAHPALDQLVEDLSADLLGAGAEMPGQGRLEGLGGAPGPLETLGRHAQPVRVTDQRGLRATGVVAVQVGRRVAGQDMQLDETGHGQPLCLSNE